MTQDEVLSKKKTKKKTYNPAALLYVQRASQNGSSKHQGEEYYGLIFFTESCKIVGEISNRGHNKKMIHFAVFHSISVFQVVRS